MIKRNLSKPPQVKLESHEHLIPKTVKLELGNLSTSNILKPPRVEKLGYTNENQNTVNLTRILKIITIGC